MAVGLTGVGLTVLGIVLAYIKKLSDAWVFIFRTVSGYRCRFVVKFKQDSTSYF
jgi:hypothetical protein